MIPTPITEAAIRQALPPALQGLDIRVFDELDSTNTYAKRLTAETVITAPVLIIARHQTAGRGRLGRSFYSPEGTGLYMSLLYPTYLPLSQAVGVTGATAVAVCHAVEEICHTRPAIKWVNDVYVDGCKVCGILTEAVTPLEGALTHMIVGIGVNISTHRFPDGLRAPATSLAASGKVAPDPNVLAAVITNKLLSLIYNDPYAPATVADYRAHLLWIGERVLCTQGNAAFEATVDEVEDNYALRLHLDNGQRLTLDSGEISIRSL